MVINGDSERSIVAASLGGRKAQADWLGPKVSSCSAIMLHSPNELHEFLQWQCHDDRLAFTITITVAAADIVSFHHSMPVHLSKNAFL